MTHSDDEPESPAAHGAGVASRVLAALEAAEAVRAATPDEPLSKPAHELVRLAVADVAVKVRQIFAENVKNAAGLPRYAAIALARDFETVALPILGHSPALSAADLIALVKLGTKPKQAAIAERSEVPTAVAEAIIESNNVEAVALLLDNPHADLSVDHIRHIHDEYGQLDFINAALGARSGLPEELTTRLAWASLPLLEDVGIEARARKIAAAVANKETAQREILKAVLSGDHLFAVGVLAELSGLSKPVTATLLCDRGLVGARALLHKAGLDLNYARVLSGAMATLREAQFGVTLQGWREHAKRCLSRVMTQGGELPADEARELETLFAGLGPSGSSRSGAVLNRFVS